ncbi:hypothetical protein M2401_006574 [Pseudomonas sp. JUb42]|jgi:hypothetical protein|uniref:hypothetical protein n=1 Tax=Pseudomonas sp. JUb42 TaxID=2940611 RepID=UPI002169ED13|nr:hypothetical protein [Pseudomonas sp. JUb42]MCS3472808.1 hypothetical protein [Pseudomonas sp. JUb42]
MFSVLPDVEESRKEIKEFWLDDFESDAYSLGHMDSLKTFDVDEKNPEGAVANDVVISIVSGMSKKNKQIVKDTVLLSSMGARKKFPAGGIATYNEFIRRMSLCGWTFQHSAMSTYTTESSRFTMEQEGLKILASAVSAMALPGPTSALMLKVAKDTIDVLRANDKPLRLFESSSKTKDGVGLSIASAVESDGEVLMAVGAIDLATSLDVTNVLFWEWNSSSVSVNRGECQMFLNHRHFESVQSEIEKVLTEAARKALMDFEI